MITLAMLPCKNGHLAKRYKDGRCSRCSTDSCMKWRRSHPDSVRSLKKRHAAKENERRRRITGERRMALRKRHNAWLAQNTDKVAVWNRKSKVRRKGAFSDGSVEAYWPMIVSAYQGLCCYCEKPYEHMDHVIALKNNGAHVAWNVRPACAKCNLTKKAQTWIPRPWAAALPSEAI